MKLEPRHEQRLARREQPAAEEHGQHQREEAAFVAGRTRYDDALHDRDRSRCATPHKRS